MKLTIAIPTYNRNEILERNLALLLPQFTDQCQLLVIDNCSPVPVENTLQTLLARFPNVSFEIIRNRANIGGNANILRCMEMCLTPYLWILGDDDPVKPDALATVLEHLDAHPDCYFFNFSFDDVRRETFTTTGLQNLVDGLDISANLMWISSSIYRIETMKPTLKLGYQSAFSMLPHVAMLIMSCGKEGKCCFSKESIVVLDEAMWTPIEQQWSRVNFALGMPTLYDLPMPHPLREKLSRHLLSAHWAGGIDLQFVTHQLLLEYLKYGDHPSTMYYFDQICARGYYLNSSPKSKAQVRFFRLLLLWPRLTDVMMLLLKRKRLNSLPLQERHARI